MTYLTPTGVITYALAPRFVCRMLAGINRVETAYGVYSPGGKPRVHYGADIDTPGADWRVRATVSGKVVSSIIVTDHSNPTWEWGHYVCIQDAEGYRHYFCHLASRAVSAGQTVKAGDVLGVMGKTGNAAGDRQAEHVHYEVRKSPYRYGADAVDPTPWAGIPNRQGWTGEDVPAGLPWEGVDVSKYQGVVDWPKVAAAGKRFAIIRAGSWVNKKLEKDPYYEANYKGAVENGLHVGAYFYSHSWTADSIHSEAAFFLGVIKGKKFDMPVYMDMEYDKEVLALSNTKRTDYVIAFLSDLEAAGYYAGLYASTDFINNLLERDRLAAYDMWAAQYGPACTCKLPYGIWQHHGGPQVNGAGVETWPGGICAGIGGWVDLDTCHTDYPSIIKAAGLNGYAAAPEPPPPEKGEKTMLELFIASAADLEMFTRPDVAAFILDPDGKNGTRRLPAGEYVVYESAPLAGIEGVGGVRVKVDGSLYWAAKLPGKYRVDVISLEDAEKEGMLGAAMPADTKAALDRAEDATVSTEAAIVSMGHVLDSLAEVKAALGVRE